MCFICILLFFFSLSVCLCFGRILYLIFYDVFHSFYEVFGSSCIASFFFHISEYVDEVLLDSCFIEVYLIFIIPSAVYFAPYLIYYCFYLFGLLFVSVFRKNIVQNIFEVYGGCCCTNILIIIDIFFIYIWIVFFGYFPDM